MAETKSTVIDLKINTANSAKSIGEMNKALKDLKSELNSVAAGSAEWKKLSNAINETEGKIGDINDSFKTLAGSGVDRVNSSIGLFKEGLFSFDFGKMGIALKGLGAAFKAVLPFALIEGVKLLYENWDKIMGMLSKIIPALDSVSKKTHDLEEENEQLLETNKKLNSVYETRIILLEAMGKKDEEINQLKGKILANDIKQLEIQARLSRAKEEDAAATSTMYEQGLRLFHFEKMADEEKQERLKKISDETSKIEGELSKKRAESAATRIKDIDLQIKKTKEHSDAVIKGMINDANLEKTRNEESKKAHEDRLKREQDWGKAVTDGLQNEFERRKSIIEWERQEKQKEDEEKAKAEQLAKDLADKDFANKEAIRIAEKDRRIKDSLEEAKLRKQMI